MSTPRPVPKKSPPRERKQQVSVADHDPAVIPEVVDTEQEAFGLMDRQDEIQIMESMVGRFSQKFVYDIPFRDRRSNNWRCDLGDRCLLFRNQEAHKHVRGLSWTGVKEGIRLWGHVCIEVTRPILETFKGVDYFVCSAIATDTMRDVTFKGISKRVALKRTITSKEGKTWDEEDPFAFEKAQSLAMRNGAQNLLPQALVKAWFEDFIAGREGLSISHVMTVARETGALDRKVPRRDEQEAERPQPQASALPPAKSVAPPVPPVPPAPPAKPIAQAKPPAVHPATPPAQAKPQAPNPSAKPQGLPAPKTPAPAQPPMVVPKSEQEASDAMAEAVGNSSVQDDLF